MEVSDKASYFIEKKEIKVVKWGTPKKNMVRLGLVRSGQVSLGQVMLV